MQSNWLSAFRELHGISQTALAQAAGVHRVTLSRVERGQEEPSVSTALRICRALEDLSNQALKAQAPPGFDREAVISVEEVFGDPEGRWLEYAASDLRDARAAAEADRARRGVPPPDEPDPFLPAGPFMNWLIGQSESDKELAHMLGVDVQRVRTIRTGKRQKVRESVVDRAGVLRQLYG